MVHPSLHFAAARFVLHLAKTDELIDAAHAALNDSIYSYSLGELATFRQPTWYEISPLFVNALKELEIPMPSLDEAIDAALCFHLSAIAEGDVTPEQGASELHAVSMTIDRLSRQQVSEELVSSTARH